MRVAEIAASAVSLAVQCVSQTAFLFVCEDFRQRREQLS